MKWKVIKLELNDYWDYYVVDEEDRPIAELSEKNEHNLRDAELIAAAPELLEQLELAIAELKNIWSIPQNTRWSELERREELKKRIEAAIAKAEGRGLMFGANL